MSAAVSLFLCRFCAKYQPVFCSLLLCSSAGVLLFVSYFDGWLQLALRQTSLPGRRMRWLHVLFFSKRSFFGSFCSFRWRKKKDVMTKKWQLLSRVCKDSSGKSEALKLSQPGFEQKEWRCWKALRQITLVLDKGGLEPKYLANLTAL